jgi:hypothetical protein
MAERLKVFACYLTTLYVVQTTEGQIMWRLLNNEWEKTCYFMRYLNNFLEALGKTTSFRADHWNDNVADTK